MRSGRPNSRGARAGTRGVTTGAKMARRVGRAPASRGRAVRLGMPPGGGTQRLPYHLRALQRMVH